MLADSSAQAEVAFFFLIQLKSSFSGNGVAHGEPGHLMPINNQDPTSLTCLQAKLIQAIPPFRVPSQGALGRCQVGIQNQTGHNVTP